MGRQTFARQENIQLYGPLNLSIGKSGMLMIDKINARLHIKLADTTQLILKIIANGSALDFELTFPNKCSVLYNRVIDSMNTDRNSITYSKFGSGATIITADCKNSETNSIMQIERRGHLEIHMWFSATLPNPINIIIIGLTVGSVEIDFD